MHSGMLHSSQFFSCFNAIHSGAPSHCPCLAPRTVRSSKVVTGILELPVASSLEELATEQGLETMVTNSLGLEP